MWSSSSSSSTPKAIAKQLKRHARQPLRYYCQLCERQCRDANGYRAHCRAPAHQQRQRAYDRAPEEHRARFSQRFVEHFIAVLRRRAALSEFADGRVPAKSVYDEVVADRAHVRLHATQWRSLGGFLRWLVAHRGDTVVQCGGDDHDHDDNGKGDDRRGERDGDEEAAVTWLALTPSAAAAQALSRGGVPAGAVAARVHRQKLDAEEATLSHASMRNDDKSSSNGAARPHPHRQHGDHDDRSAPWPMHRAPPTATTVARAANVDIDDTDDDADDDAHDDNNNAPPWLQSGQRVRIVNSEIADGRLNHAVGIVQRVMPDNAYVGEVHVRLDNDDDANQREDGALLYTLRIDQDELQQLLLL